MVEIESHAENIGVTNDIEKSFKELNLTVHKQKVHMLLYYHRSIFVRRIFTIHSNLFSELMAILACGLSQSGHVFVLPLLQK